MDIIAALIVVFLAGILLYSIITGKMPSGKSGGDCRSEGLDRQKEEKAQ
jgi:hypothetical protein